MGFLQLFFTTSSLCFLTGGFSSTFIHLLKLESNFAFLSVKHTFPIFQVADCTSLLLKFSCSNFDSYPPGLHLSSHVPTVFVFLSRSLCLSKKPTVYESAELVLKLACPHRKHDGFVILQKKPCIGNSITDSSQDPRNITAMHMAVLIHHSRMYSANNTMK